MTNILVFSEIDENGIIKASQEIIAYCAANFHNAAINTVVLTAPENKETVKNQLTGMSIDNLYVLTNENYNAYSTEIYTDAVVNFLTEYGHDVFLIAATPQGRDLAPRIASRMNIGLTADCTEIGLDEKNMLLATRPTYGGKLMATILSKTTPQFATIRPGALKLPQGLPSKNTNIIELYPTIDATKLMCEILSFKRKYQDNDWTTADIIVAGGRGLGSKENFDLIYKLCDAIDAKPAASRCAVELGWAESGIQVGQTGCSIAPKLYLAFGISGAMQHLVGIENAEKIIAVNTDTNAPIMSSSDIAINADAVETLKNLIMEAKPDLL